MTRTKIKPYALQTTLTTQKNRPFSGTYSFLKQIFMCVYSTVDTKKKKD